MRKYFIIAILTMLFTYLAFAFVKADLNAFNWKEEVRFLFVWLAVSFAALLVSINKAIDFEPIKKEKGL